MQQIPDVFKNLEFSPIVIRKRGTGDHEGGVSMSYTTKEELNYANFFERINQKDSSHQVEKPVCDQYVIEYKRLMEQKIRRQEDEANKEISLAEYYIY